MIVRFGFAKRRIRRQVVPALCFFLIPPFLTVVRWFAKKQSADSGITGSFVSSTRPPFVFGLNPGAADRP